jgi:toxin-antitoxin system PIN domain toxin
MTRFLLDVNVLIALINPVHVHRPPAANWFSESGQHDWLTGSLTENGVVRIVSNPRYSNPQASLAAVIESVRSLTMTGNHSFIPDELSLIDDEIFDASNLISPHQITDTYLLALAAHHNATLATFDRRIVASAVRASNAAIHVIGSDE